MSAEAIAAIFTGLTGLIAALAAYTANRSRRVGLEQKVLRRRVRQLERQVLALVEHTFTLELEIARHGGKVPDRPLVLEQMDADADDEDATTFPNTNGAPPTPVGRHSHRRE